jgi:hypothetical protein
MMVRKVLVVLALLASVMAGAPLWLIVSVCLAFATHSFYQAVLAFQGS